MSGEVLEMFPDPEELSSRIRPGQLLARFTQRPVSPLRRILRWQVEFHDASEDRKVKSRIATMNEGVRNDFERAGFRYIGAVVEEGLLKSFPQACFSNVEGSVRASVSGDQWERYNLWTYFDDGTAVTTWSHATVQGRSTEQHMQFGGLGSIANDVDAHMDRVAEAMVGGRKPMIVEDAQDVLDCFELFYRHIVAELTIIGQLFFFAVMLGAGVFLTLIVLVNFCGLMKFPLILRQAWGASVHASWGVLLLLLSSRSALPYRSASWG